jgi:hypothetical protein
MAKLVQLDGVVPLTVEIDLHSGQLVRAWIDRDQITWHGPSVHVGTYRRTVIGNHTAAKKAADEAPTWCPIFERNPNTEES